MKADTADQPETRISESSSKRSTSPGRWRTSAHSRVTTNINSRSSARANVLRARHCADLTVANRKVQKGATGGVTRKRKNPKASTINRELGILSKIFSLAIKYGITHSNPCRDIPWLPENNKRVRYLLDEEEPKLFAILNGRRKHLRPLVTVAIRHGNEARRSIEFAMGES
jgi:hypothetical protein